MNRTISDLDKFQDDRLFKEISDGIPLIVQNAISFDTTAHGLYQLKEFRASEIIRGFAVEEAAKVLILLDAVRCPRDAGRLSETLKCYYSHFWKRIYAEICSFPKIVSFKELYEFINLKCRPYILDGPKMVDWIIPNSIIDEREQEIYVDYVRDINTDTDEHFWRIPEDLELDPEKYMYESPDVVRLCHALSEAGAKSPEGLAIIAEIWRDFVPNLKKGREELCDLIACTLDRLTECGQTEGDKSLFKYITSYWSFPLWPLLPIKMPSNKETLEELRKERRRTIKRIKIIEAKREPPPTIARQKVEALNEAYLEWEIDTKPIDSARSEDKEGGWYFDPIRVDTGMWFELPSYSRLENMFRELDNDERASLLALAWFAREQIADWPHVFKRASSSVLTLSNDYQIGLAKYWLAGLNRWEEEPGTFSAKNK